MSAAVIAGSFAERRCEKCGTPLTRRAREKPAALRRRRFCSYSCSNSSRPRASAETRFDDQWMPEPNSGCWLWLGAVKDNGYGTIGIGGRRYMPAHRYAYSTYRGPVPTHLMVCHKCDNPLCVNPDHLFLGTAKDNAQDRDAKGRGRQCPPELHAKGERHWKARLTAEKVLAIRADDRATAAIAGDYGIKPGTVRAIIRRRIWRHLP